MNKLTNKKGGEMKKLMFVVIGLFLFTSMAFACVGEDCKSDGNVMYSGEGNKGNIFVYDCNKNDKSNTNIGIWVDPKDVPELKGEQGDTGEMGQQGIQGIQGLKGDTGQAGIAGLNGLNGSNGIDGQNGLNGAQGEQGIAGQNGLDGQSGLNGLNGEQGERGLQGNQGDKGDKGDIGNEGDKGDNGEKGNTGDTGLQGLQGIQGLEGITGLNGKDVDPKEVKRLDNKNAEQDNKINDLDHRVGKLEQTQYVAEFDFRIYDSKRLTISPFIRQNFTRSTLDTIGVKFTIKLGASYEEKLIAKQNKRLEVIEKKLNTPQAVLEREVVKDTKGNIISESFHISESGWKVETKF
jgi:hypothetical protein